MNKGCMEGCPDHLSRDILSFVSSDALMDVKIIIRQIENDDNKNVHFSLMKFSVVLFYAPRLGRASILLPLRDLTLTHESEVLTLSS